MNFKCILSIGFSFSCFAAQVVFAQTPQFDVKWENAEHSKIQLSVTHQNEEIQECQKSGSEVYFRFDYELCVRRKGWSDKCTQQGIATRTLRSDPISESFTVYSDNWGDSLPPEKHVYTSLDESLTALATVNSIQIKLDEKESRAQYLNTRMRFACKGQSSALLGRLSQIITLGMVSLGGIDTGWQEFDFPH